MDIDIMPEHILLSIDLEDHTSTYAADARYINNTKRLLDYLAAHQLKATFFTVGRIAEHTPLLVQQIATAGHEIACHSYDHTPLTKQSPAQFKEHTLKAKMILEQTIGDTVTGYRAPIFSLTKQTSWAPDILQELGFSYSSSVIPMRHPLYGYPGIPKIPFVWPSGLIELPVAVGRFGGIEVLFLGGIYLRYLPDFLIKQLLAKLPAGSQPWTYLHPYDIDAKERNWYIENANLVSCLLLWFNRRSTFAKLDALRHHFYPLPFKNAIQQIAANIAT